ncbi:hypothetical protein QM012_000132 [Aureobasidium pullulans]|uniref:Rhodopsin domain-containing protein n=1 Tax=Aureobasidium pullulans TaxID=5580 RepID=A0ABR0TVH8_AURPU
MTGRFIDLNASPWLWVETTWAVILCVLVLVLRLVVRSHECGLEDLLLILAFVLAMASFGCIYQALHNGLGIPYRSLPEEQTLRIALLAVDSSCLCFVADGFSKLSTIAMLYKIICRGTTRDKKLIAVFAGVSGLTVVWTISAAAAWASRCSQPYISPAPQSLVCSHGTKSLEAILILSIMIELFIFVSSSYLFCGLNMRTQHKVAVITIFGMRLPLIPLSVSFLIAFNQYMGSKNTSTIMYGSALYWQIALLGYSFLATAIQPLKRAATSLSTHTKVSNSDNSRSTRSGQSSKLRSLNKPRQSLLLTKAEPSTPLPMIRPDAQAQGQQDSDSIESHGSQDRIVKKMDFRVTYSPDRRA